MARRLVLVLTSALAFAGVANAGTSSNGVALNGANLNGVSLNGVVLNGARLNRHSAESAPCRRCDEAGALRRLGRAALMAR